MAPSSHKQALSALLFPYGKVLGKDLPWMAEIGRPKAHRRLPVVFSRDEIGAVFGQLGGEHRLLAVLAVEIRWRGDLGQLSGSLEDVRLLLGAHVVRQAKEPWGWRDEFLTRARAEHKSGAVATWCMRLHLVPDFTRPVRENFPMAVFIGLSRQVVAPARRRSTNCFGPISVRGVLADAPARATDARIALVAACCWRMRRAPWCGRHEAGADALK